MKFIVQCILFSAFFYMFNQAKYDDPCQAGQDICDQALDLPCNKENNTCNCLNNADYQQIQNNKG